MNKKGKKLVIAYLHTHWDREWYREFEVFRLRLSKVMDNVINLLEKGKIPCFYFDGQTSALEDYLELNPEKEPIVRKLIKEKKLFIGPCYCLVDEFLTDGLSFRKNLEIGLKYAHEMGCKDFIGYFADTFGHSQNVPLILKEFGINKAIVWRGCSEDLPAEFFFNGVKTVNLIRGYFNDIFSTKLSIEKKAEFLKDHLDKIAKKSTDTLLMPIGADHLNVEEDIQEQIKEVNKHLKDYQIELSSPFKYFDLVSGEFEIRHNDELRDNSATFILPGCYSSRNKIKQLNTECSYHLELADKFQKYATRKFKTKPYDNSIEYAYKLLLQNQAHDGICGCSTDLVHSENEIRYQKILQISKTIIEEIKHEVGKPLITNLSNDVFNGIIEFESCEKLSKKKYQLISKRKGFESDLLHNSKRIPITEDYRDIYTYITEVKNKAPSKPLAKKLPIEVGILSESDLIITDTSIENSKISLSIKKGEIIIFNKLTNQIYENFFEFVDFKDLGDTYNFAPDEKDNGTKAKFLSSKTLRKGALQVALNIKFKLATEVLNLQISLNKESYLLNFKANWINKRKNHILQAKFNLREPIETTYSEDMNMLIERNFDPKYEIRKNLPKERGIEAKTNTAPMQRYVQTQGFEVITKGLREYEVKNNSLLVTLLRSTGVISNPKNPARSTPAGPPLEVPNAQQLGENQAEFSIGFNTIESWQKSIDEVFPMIVTNL